MNTTETPQLYQTLFEEIPVGSRWRNKKTGNTVTVTYTSRIEELKTDYVSFDSKNSKVSHQSKRKSFTDRYERV